MAKFTDVFIDVTKEGHKIPKENYLSQGRYPIIDQGQEYIAGYSNESDGLYENVPAIIFGDHTRIIKYVDMPCFLGADGVKLLKAKDVSANYKYLYYALCHAQIPNTGYNRHFKWLKEVEIKLPSKTEQQHIVDVLDKFDDLISLRKQQLAKLGELGKARFVEIFGDPRTNDRDLPIIKLSELGEWSSGGTPPRSRPEYFKGGIDWYSAGELNTLYLEGSVERITQEAITNSAAKIFRAGSMLIGMYDTAAFKMGILQKDSSSNQACACIEPNNRVNIVWLYYTLQLLKDYYLQQRRGVRQKNLNLGMIKEFELPLAEKTEQEQFATFVEKTDISNLTIQQSLDKLELLKKSLMQQYFG